HAQHKNPSHEPPPLADLARSAAQETTRGAGRRPALRRYARGGGADGTCASVMTEGDVAAFESPIGISGALPAVSGMTATGPSSARKASTGWAYCSDGQ